MRFRNKLMLGSLLALALGLSVSLPILFSNLRLMAKTRIEVNIAYAYFELQVFQNITGLWKNLSQYQDSYYVSYFIVLNITNLSDSTASIDTFEVAAAPEILVHNGSEKIGSQKLAKQTSTAGSDFGVSMENAIMHEVRTVKWYPGWSQYWSPNRSRLIGISGLLDVWNLAYQETLANGTIYLYGEAEGRSMDGSAYSRGFDLKHVNLQKTGNASLYNAIIGDDQIFRIDGLDVRIETRH